MAKVAKKIEGLENLKKGDTVILHMFTGLAVNVCEIVGTTKTSLTIKTVHDLKTFDNETGRQIDPPVKSPGYANFVTPDDGSFKEYRKGGSKKKTKDEKPLKAKSKPKKKVEEKSKKRPPGKVLKKLVQPEPKDIDDDEEEFIYDPSEDNYDDYVEVT